MSPVKLFHIDPNQVPPGPSQGLVAEYRGQRFKVLVGLEPFMEGKYGIHVSVAHEKRRTNDDELKAIADKLFAGKRWEEDNGGSPRGDLIRHVWEV